MTTTDPRTASVGAAPIQDPLSGPGTLNGHPADDAQTSLAVEGQDSPQANSLAVPKHQPPAGNTDPRTAKVLAAPTDAALSGPDVLNGQPMPDTHVRCAIEGQTASRCPIPMSGAPLRASIPRRPSLSRCPCSGRLRGARRPLRPQITRQPNPQRRRGARPASTSHRPIPRVAASWLMTVRQPGPGDVRRPRLMRLGWRTRQMTSPAATWLPTPRITARPGSRTRQPGPANARHPRMERPGWRMASPVTTGPPAPM